MPAQRPGWAVATPLPWAMGYYVAAGDVRGGAAGVGGAGEGLRPWGMSGVCWLSRDLQPVMGTSRDGVEPLWDGRETFQALQKGPPARLEKRVAQCHHDST